MTEVDTVLNKTRVALSLKIWVIFSPKNFKEYNLDPREVLNQNTHQIKSIYYYVQLLVILQSIIVHLIEWEPFWHLFMSTIWINALYIHWHIKIKLNRTHLTIIYSNQTKSDPCNIKSSYLMLFQCPARASFIPEPTGPWRRSQMRRCFCFM